MKVIQPSKVFSFRVQADLAREIDDAVKETGKDKSAWLLSAVLEKLGRPGSSRSPESRIEVLIGRMEGLFTGTGALTELNHYHGHAANSTSLNR
ncbi:hypothetical protein [Edaphovirga cremea]|uniref:hypothetical protein n=1 Tax=Edaphovirga cremea TaxID=2267246 RepID=UPI000DEF64F2|nr:hypothetical protein [Edaphovirga cremea]